MRATSVRNARPVRISAPSRLRHSDSYARSLVSLRSSLAQRSVECAGGKPATDQAVVDPAAGRRLDESRGVADGEHAGAVGSRDRAQRKNLQARLGPAVLRHAEPVAHAAGERPESRGRAGVAHQPDAVEWFSRTGERHQPRKSDGATSRPRWTSTCSGPSNGRSSWALCTNVRGTPSPSWRLSR